MSPEQWQIVKDNPIKFLMHLPADVGSVVLDIEWFPNNTPGENNKPCLTANA